MKIIKLPIHNIVIRLTSKDPDKPELYISGMISSNDLKKNCPYCGKPDCYNDCDEVAGGGAGAETDSELLSRRLYNCAIDAVESIVLAHAVAGIDVECPAYFEGLDTVLNKIADEFGN
jgi:hypothetical protein